MPIVSPESPPVVPRAQAAPEPAIEDGAKFRDELLTAALIRHASQLSGVVAALISMSALLYLVGWISAYFYLRSLGAAWLVSLFSAGDFVSYAPSLILLFPVFVFIGFASLATGKWAAASIESFGLFIFGLGVVLSLTAQLMGSIWDVGSALTLGQLAALAYWLSAAALVVVILSAAAEPRFRPSSRTLQVLAVVAVCAIGVAPGQIAYHKGANAAWSQKSLLPHVIGEHLEGDPRLLLAKDGIYYVVDISKHPNEIHAVPVTAASIRRGRDWLGTRIMRTIQDALDARASRIIAYAGAILILGIGLPVSGWFAGLWRLPSQEVKRKSQGELR